METDHILNEIALGLRNVGYRKDLLVRDYDYADYTGLEAISRSVLLAGFAQTPPDYRSACIGVIETVGKGRQEKVKHCRFLGAPLLFEIHQNELHLWKIKEKEPEYVIWIDKSTIQETFQLKRDLWNPSRIFNAKRSPEKQLDFVDAGHMSFLEGRIKEKLRDLLEETIGQIIRCGVDSEINDVLRIVFYFIAAKVFRDREYHGKWDTPEAENILNAIGEHYGEIIKVDFSSEITNLAWTSINSSFHFQNLSVEDLAFIYENTFVTKSNRKELGIYSTPSHLAEYIVKKLPIEELVESERIILDPFSGSGVFLVAALRELRGFLPADIKSIDRHEYFQKNLIGIEIDEFAVEVSKLCLMLADFPNKDSWQANNADVFITDKLEESLEKVKIVVSNPPFEKFCDKYREANKSYIKEAYQPAEFLYRLLRKPPQYMGIILPLAFLHGNSYRIYREKLFKVYSNIEILRLAEGAFENARFEAVILFAYGSRQKGDVVHFIKNTADKDTVKNRTYMENEKNRIEIEVDEKDEKTLRYSIWIAKNINIWKYLIHHNKLGDKSIAEIHKGICHISPKSFKNKKHHEYNMVSDIDLPGFKSGYCGQSRCFTQYDLNEQKKYISMKPEDNYDKNFRFMWDAPKIVCNNWRVSRGPWRLVAAHDPDGEVFTNKFFAIWKRGEYSLLEIAAILNSPVANAFLFEHDLDMNNRIRTLKKLPLPPISALKDEKVDDLAKELIDLIHKKRNQVFQEVSNKIKNILLSIDAAVLKSYDLPPRLERRLLEMFQGEKRPIPYSDFTGYYPTGMDAAIPLHMIISSNFAEASAIKTKKRLVTMKDDKISEMLRWLNR